MPHWIWESIANTPWWVYVMMAYLIHIGIKATHPHQISLRQCLYFPLMFIFLSICLMSALVDHWTLALLERLCLSLIAGVLFGMLQFKFLGIKAIPQTQQLQQPGSYGVLIMTFIMIALKCYLGDQFLLDLSLLQYLQQPKWLLIVHGFMSGLFIGRILSVLRCLRRGPFVNIASQN